jgi:hypothetical protein
VESEEGGLLTSPLRVFPSDVSSSVNAPGGSSSASRSGFSLVVEEEALAIDADDGGKEQTQIPRAHA